MNSQDRRRPQTEIRFPIEARTDKYGDTYYLGWTDAPAQLDMSDCAFFIFLGDDAEVCIRKRRDIKDNRNKRQRSKPYKGNSRDSGDDQGNFSNDYDRSDEYEEEELDQ